MSLTDPQNPNVNEELEAIKGEHFLEAERYAMMSMSAFIPAVECHSDGKHWVGLIFGEDQQVLWVSNGYYLQHTQAFNQAAAEWDRRLAAKARAIYEMDYL